MAPELIRQRVTDRLKLKWNPDLLGDCDPDLRPRVFRGGNVKVLEVPCYVKACTVVSLRPGEYRLLGSVASLRTLPKDAGPPLGFRWFVVTKENGRRGLAAWKEEGDPSGDAFVSYWNQGVAAGWGDHLEIEIYEPEIRQLDTKQIARLERTPQLRRYLGEAECAA